MSVDRQENIAVTAGETLRSTRLGGPPIHRGVRWLSPWWRTWDAREHTFAHHAYDPHELLDHIIHTAATDFQEERPWPHAGARRAHSSWRLWEQFRLVVGLSYRPVLPRLAHKELDDEVSDDSSDEEDPPTRPYSPPPTRANPAGVNKHRVFRGVGAFYEEDDDRAAERGMTPHEQWLRHMAEMKDNMARFILDAEKVMKFFFSAYFLHHGLMTTPEACYNIPVIASYFLRFLLRHLDLDEGDKAMFERALAVTEHAHFQLPLIYQSIKCATIAGDVFSLFCRATFGEIPPVHDDLAMIFSNISVPSLATNDSGTDDPSSEGSASPPQTHARHEHSELHSNNIALDLISDQAERAWLSTSGAEVADEIAALDAIGVDDEDDPWTTKKPNLPLPDLAHTHVRGLVEASVRRIVGVFLPDTAPSACSTAEGAAEQSLTQTSWSLKLAPEPSFRSWYTPDWEAWPGYESATLRVQADGRESRDAPIRLLVSPVVGAVLARCPGMLLCGDFAELAPRTGGQGNLWYLHQFVGLAPNFYEPDRPDIEDSTPRALGQPYFADLLSTS